MKEPEFKVDLKTNIWEMILLFFKKGNLAETSFIQLHDEIKIQLMGEGSPHGVKNSQTKK
jgi:hypothetical protein